MLKIYQKYIKNAADRTATTGLTSFLINAFTGSVQFIMGIVFLSPWYVVNSLYYLLLCMARGQALRRFRKAITIPDQIRRYDDAFTVYKRGGVFICLLGISYFCISSWMFTTGESRVQNDIALVLGVAAVAFTKIGFAIHGLIVNRHMRDPIVSLFKTINFLDATVSIIVTQCTLLTMSESEAAVSSSSLFGMGVSIWFFIIGVRMLFRKKKLPDSQQETPMENSKPQLPGK